MAWRCAGISWPRGTRMPVLVWEGGRVSPLASGKELGFRAEGERRCVGARGNPCPPAAVVSGRAMQARCGECARLDRAHSVAADTMADDPRTYRVYLAWFGPGMVKVGITAEERGAARLLEQGAVVFSWLGRGPLMAARRTEELLRTALGVPDRIPYAAKRAVRAELPGMVERAVEIEALHRRAVALDGWAESLERVAFEAVDHAEAFGLDGLPTASGVVRELVDGGVVAGRLVAAAGPDLHLRTAADALVVLDTRLMTGWGLTGADAGSGVTVPVVGTGGGGAVQDGLF
ncbi:DUF2797 domain-containing protein [Streptomyces sp. NBC_01142]|uniref:DUF2797 domain-containing protein n=1 Tax=Streptomyces sp. NBC_01142 TaxID=2975865 RepID=UPI0022539F76|nr:DUF2797 domain-containing protein [Streptomyces sp. NBC_01142]MCX4824203.1 DUF2797 domain-containing protein [Streptomyces sp. NBC_01142]